MRNLAVAYGENRANSDKDKTNILAVSCLAENRSSRARFCEDVSDRLGRALFIKGANVVESEKVERLIAEQRRQTATWFDENRTVSMGRLLGASQMGIGNFAEAGDHITLSFKFIDVETGLMASVAEAQILSETVSRLFPENQDGDTFRVVAVDLEIEPTKADGLLWDATGVEEAPDVSLTLRFGKNKVMMFQAQDTLTHQWTPQGTNEAVFVYDSRDPVSVVVLDRDVMFDDPVAELRLEHGIPIADVRNGQFQPAPFGRVKSLVVRFQKP